MSRNTNEKIAFHRNTAFPVFPGSAVLLPFWRNLS